MQQHSVLLKAHPVGEPKDSDFECVTNELGELAEGSIRVKLNYFSVDPYLRGKMSGKTDSYFVPFKIGGPIDSMAAGVVLQSKAEGYAEGDRVIGGFPWSDVTDVVPSPENMIKKLPDAVDDQTALTSVGITGLTAYYGLLIIGKLEEKKPGSTVLVSGAAGATGNVVGQIAKIKGYRVVGLAGSEDKVSWLKNDLHFDEVINYRTSSNLFESIKAACPDGIDLYFDNVGGETFDHAIALMNRFGVIVNCGAISLYNAVQQPTGPRIEWAMISKSLRMQGFIVSDFLKDSMPAVHEIVQWVQQGKLQQRVDIYESTGDVSGIPTAWMKMLQGSNIGKMLVKLA